jgi:hypothetical protein
VLSNPAKILTVSIAWLLPCFAAGEAEEGDRRVTADAHLDMDTLVEAIEALNDGIAIYDSNANPIFTNGVTRRRFAKMYADMEAGLTHQQAIEAMVRRRLPPDAPSEEIERLTTHFAQKFHSGETYSSVSDDGRQVLITFRPMSRGLKAAIGRRHRPAQARARAQAGDEERRESKRLEIILPRQHEPRDPHAAQWRARHGAGAGGDQPRRAAT